MSYFCFSSHGKENTAIIFCQTGIAEKSGKSKKKINCVHNKSMEVKHESIRNFLRKKEPAK